MIVFWRLFLAYYLADFILHGRFFHNYGEKNPWKFALIRGGVFVLLGALFCWQYLSMNWAFLGLVHLPGWLAIIPLGIFYVFSDGWFKLNGTHKYHNTLSFILHEFFNLLVLFLAVPFRALYDTGSFFTEKWVIFCVGLLFVTKILGTFIYCIEKDVYGRDYPTPDERWIMMLMRAIFFLTGLLPGWRWLFFTLACWGAVIYARRIRLMDVSPIAFYFGFAATCIVSWAVHLRVYLNW